MVRKNSNSSKRLGVALMMFAMSAAGMADTALAQRPVSRNFEENAPAVGQMMPDVVVYDHDGAERRLGDLLGEQYTVLILGCLT